jgi:general secretion pathway protein A
LNQCLLSTLSEQGNLAILIDEAQNLSLEVMEELRMLSNLETRTSKLIQIVFVGQPELEEKLNSRDLKQIKQRIAIRSQIRPLTADEARQYIDHRLRLVGKSTGEVFSPEAVALIVRHAEGIPRTINLLCDHALLIGYRRKEKRIPVATAKEVLSNRGMMVEEKGKKIVGAPLRGARIRRSYPRDAFWESGGAGLDPHLSAGMGHLGQQRGEFDLCEK